MFYIKFKYHFRSSVLILDFNSGEINDTLHNQKKCTFCTLWDLQSCHCQNKIYISLTYASFFFQMNLEASGSMNFLPVIPGG